MSDDYKSNADLNTNDDMQSRYDLYKAARDLDMVESSVADDITIRNLQAANSSSLPDSVDISSTVAYGKHLEDVASSLYDINLNDDSVSTKRVK